MARSLTLKEKAFILVFVPFTFEVGFIAFSMHLQNETERELSRQAHSREVVATCNALIGDVYASRTGFSNRGIPDPSLIRRIESHIIPSLSARVKTIKRLVKGNPEEYKAATLLKVTCDDNVETLLELKKNILADPLSSKEYIKKSGVKLRKSTDTINLAINVILDGEKRIESESPVVQERIRTRTRNVLMLAVGLNFILAIALAAYFNRGTARRLNILVDNTHRLAENKPLNPPLQGTDEIAQLDRVFKEMADSLGEMDRLKKDFVAMVSHDLRSPLSSIHAISTMVASGKYGEINEVGQRRLQQMNNSIERLMSLTKNLLDVEMIESGKLNLELAEVSHARLFELCIESTEAHAIQQGVELKVEPLEGATVTVDEERIVQVLVNLNNNAIKFSPKDSVIKLSSVMHEDYAEFRVSDSGRGIPDHLLDSIFDRFKQVEKTDSTVRGGSGLGLAICKSIVESHGGAIGVTSEEGKGSTFWFTVPS